MANSLNLKSLPHWASAPVETHQHNEVFPCVMVVDAKSPHIDHNPAPNLINKWWACIGAKDDHISKIAIIEQVAKVHLIKRVLGGCCVCQIKGVFYVSLQDLLTKFLIIGDSACFMGLKGF